LPQEGDGVGVVEIPDFDKKGITDFKNPFTKGSLRSIKFEIKKLWNGKIEHKSSVWFVKGKTTGCQDFEADDLVRLINKTNVFIVSL